MGEHKHRMKLSVLLPTRGRGMQLIRAIESLCPKGIIPNGVEIIVGADDDDIETAVGLQLTAVAERMQVHIAPRAVTLGQCINRLAERATGENLMWFGDDHVMAASDWAGRIIVACDDFREEPTVLYLDDTLHPGFTSLPIIPRRMMRAAQFLHAPWYPFWFGDTSWDEIATLLGSRRSIDVGLQHPDGKGKTHSLRDLPFWVEFFNTTRPIRMDQAACILKEYYGEESDTFKQRVALFREREAECMRRVAHLSNPAFAPQFAAHAEPEPNPRYDEAKADAEKLLADMRKQAPRQTRIALAIPSQSTWLARSATSVAGIAAYTSLAGIGVGILSVESSMVSKSRNDLVKIALETGADYVMWIDSDMKAPPDTVVRLLKHQLPIVGATYNKRVPPYESLGRLKGKKPDEADLSKGGLFEAEYLPGGMMLISTDVYRAIPFPWYYETYKWGGATGLDFIKTMLRSCYSIEPSAEALASLDGTMLATWAEEMWKIEGKTGWEYISEDINFCRIAQRYGYKVMCDLGLTFEMVHIGLHEVTCRMPEKKAEPVVELAAAAD